eukprot:4357447-Pyramimonas_sp.AAC.1
MKREELAKQKALQEAAEERAKAEKERARLQRREEKDQRKAERQKKREEIERLNAAMLAAREEADAHKKELEALKRRNAAMERWAAPPPPTPTASLNDSAAPVRERNRATLHMPESPKHKLHMHLHASRADERPEHESQCCSDDEKLQKRCDSDDEKLSKIHPAPVPQPAPQPTPRSDTRPAADSMPTDVQQKSQLMDTLQEQLRTIELEAAESRPNCEVETLKAMEQRLGDLYQSSLLKEVNSLKDRDPKWKSLADGIDGDEDEWFKNLSALDKQEYQYYEKIKSNDYKFTLDSSAGNEACGRWRRALAASEQLRNEYAQEKGWQNQKAFRS